MDIKKLQRKEYYEKNKERIKEKNKQYYHDNKAVRQEYNRNYWATHGQKYIEQRKLTLDHKKKYQNMKKYHKEYNIINSERISENYYKNKRDKISENYYRYKRPEVHQKYIKNNYNLCLQDNDNKSLIVYFGFTR